MYRIRKEGYGIRLTFGGSIPADEMERWLHDFEAAVAEFEEPFSVFVDMRTLAPAVSRGAGTYAGGAKGCP
ncbi:MAG: hypothetical protein KKA42_09655 [candidate division Zixibacteria bacterium]|nr:hypothetical protein [candidate division Zixibacteria bacterium]